MRNLAKIKKSEDKMSRSDHDQNLIPTILFNITDKYHHQSKQPYQTQNQRQQNCPNPPRPSPTSIQDSYHIKLQTIDGSQTCATFLSIF